jgi:hypothetical protein
MRDILVTTSEHPPPDLPAPYEGEYVLHYYRQLASVCFLVLDVYIRHEGKPGRTWLVSFADGTAVSLRRRALLYVRGSDRRYTIG